MLRRVLVPVGFREKPEQLRAMCTFLKSLGTAEVVFVHVGPNTRGAGKQNQRRIEAVADQIKSLGFSTRTVVRAGSRQMVIAGVAEELETDYIAMSFRRQSVLRRAIMGSTIKDVIRQSDIPVFVYKEPSRRRSRDDRFRAMYATSLQWGDDIILSYIRDRRFRADEIVLLHVGSRAPDPVVEQRRRDRVETQLRELRQNCGLNESDSEQLAVLGTARRQIVRVARRLSIDLVLLGKADSVMGFAPVLGSTTEEVSYNVGCSVLIIPRDVDASTEART
jgi:nucleotide-binding universal stress UspA family protein